MTSSDIDSLLSALERALGSSSLQLVPLASAHGGRVLALDLADGRKLVVKQGVDHRAIAEEASMLTDLAQRAPEFPTPRLEFAADGLIVMTRLDDDGRRCPQIEDQAATALAMLHGVTADRYGYPRPTRIGPLVQPNAWSDSWIDFFRDQRVLAMARAARDEQAIDQSLSQAIGRLAQRLGDLIDTPTGPPSLIHGDVWTGNVLARDGRLSGFIDPALCYADAEIELAFITLFNTFGGRFFDRYREYRPIRAGFFEIRRDLYNIYPLLVHVRLFGGSYVGAVRRIVDRYVD